ncbi:MAG: hypothetical protein R3A45_05730 [Bdellovibrionota bacterium]
MVDRKKYIVLLMAMPAMLLLSGCPESSRSGLVVRNNSNGLQQDVRNMGTSGRATGNNNNTTVTPQQPINQKTKEQLEQEQREKEQKEEQVSTPKTFVAKAPPSVNEFCKAIQQEVGSKDVKTLIWGTSLNQDKDGLKDDCEAILMAARYTGDLVNDTEIYDKILDYYACTPNEPTDFWSALCTSPTSILSKKPRRTKPKTKTSKMFSKPTVVATQSLVKTKKSPSIKVYRSQTIPIMFGMSSSV